MEKKDNDFASELEQTQELGLVMRFVKNLMTIKKPDTMLKQAESGGLKKTLGAFDLIILGVGAVIGSGIFTVVGIAAAGPLGAGPGLVISMILASIACVFSALCYSEFASMIPVAGSAYLYTYATMGEFMAWLIGWVLMLEYLVGYIAVLNAWTGYFMEFLKGFSAFLPDWMVNPPVYLVHDYSTAITLMTQQGLDPTTAMPSFMGIPLCINIPGILMTLIIIAILIKGMSESTKMAGLMVAIKLGVVALFVITGLFHVHTSNWFGVDGSWWHTFAPNGLKGIFMGAFLIFFAYIGFDAIATAAEETKNPQKNLPIGIIGSLCVCTIVYVLVALVLTGIMPIDQIDLQAPIANAMTVLGKQWIASLISIGALTGLTSVLLVMMLAGTRILFAMSRDGFLPKILQKLHPNFKTPAFLTVMVGIICIIGALCLDISTAAELCNFGTFASFIIVCVAVLILRKTEPERPRPFKVPFAPWTPIIGIICCSGLMLYSMKFLTTSKVLFPTWVIMGIIFYFSYGYKKQRELLKDVSDDNT